MENWHRAFRVRDFGAATIYESPDIISALRDDPRLAAFMKKLGLPDPSSVPNQWVTPPKQEAKS
jgi:hypothetical protein